MTELIEHYDKKKSKIVPEGGNLRGGKRDSLYDLVFGELFDDISHDGSKKVLKIFDSPLKSSRE